MAKFDLLTTISLQNTEFLNSIKQIQGSIVEFKSVLSSVAGVMGTAFAVKAVVDFGVECVKLAGIAEGVRNAFMKIGDSKEVLESLRTATRGTISDIGLMTLAEKASSFNIPMKDLAVYLQYATTKAIETGQSIEDLTDKIVMGVGRNAPKSFVALGISVNDTKEWLKSHSDIVGLVTQKIKDMGDVTDTTAIKIENFKASVENLKVAWGNFLNNSPAIKSFFEWIHDELIIFGDNSHYLSIWEKLNGSPNEYREFIKNFDEAKKKSAEVFQKGLRPGDMATMETIHQKIENPEKNPDPIPKEVTNSINAYALDIAGAEESIKSLDSVKNKEEIITLENEIKAWKKNIEAIQDYALAADMAKGKADYAKNPLKKVGTGNISMPTFSDLENMKLPNELAGIGMSDKSGNWIAGAKAVEEYVNRVNGAADAQDRFDALVKSTEVLKKQMNAVDELGNSFNKLGNAIGGSLGKWVSYFGTVLSSIPPVIIAINALTLAHKAKAAAESTDATAGAASAVASIPFVGPILAVAAIASMVAALLAIPKFESGGIVGGSSFTGDNVLARVNSGEMILNRQQQSNMFGGGVQEIRLRADGRDLVGVIKINGRIVNSYA